MCGRYGSNVLMDAVTETCMKLQYGLQHLTLSSNSYRSSSLLSSSPFLHADPRSPPVSTSVNVVTLGVPCSEDFHVMVTVLCPHSCPRKHKCQLYSSVTISSGHHSCWFHCSRPRSESVNQLDIRLITLKPDTFICEALWNTNRALEVN